VVGLSSSAFCPNNVLYKHLRAEADEPLAVLHTFLATTCIGEDAGSACAGWSFILLTSRQSLPSFVVRRLFAHFRGSPEVS